MNKNYFYVILLLQLFIFNCAGGQSLPEEYMQQAGQNAVLYRGPLPQILPFRYNGSIFAFQETFTRCNLWYNHKFYPNVLLNLDAYRDELYIRIPDKLVTLVLEKKAVETFILEEKEFINILPETPYKNLMPGFYQVVYNGKDKLFKKIRQIYSERPGEIDGRGV